jgi:hypothetical protein
MRLLIAKAAKKNLNNRANKKLKRPLNPIIIRPKKSLPLKDLGPNRLKRQPIGGTIVDLPRKLKEPFGLGAVLEPQLV